MTANNQNGFSLVETTIAMSLLVVAILGIAAVIVMMTSGMTSADAQPSPQPWPRTRSKR